MVWVGTVLFSRRTPTGFVMPGGGTKAGALLALSLRSDFFATFRDDSGSTWDCLLVGVRGVGMIRFPMFFDVAQFAGLPFFCLACTDLTVVEFIGAFDFKAGFLKRRLDVLGPGSVFSRRRSRSTGDVGGTVAELDSAGIPRSVLQASITWRHFVLGELSVLGLYFRRKELTIVSTDCARALFSRPAHSCRSVACIVGLDNAIGFRGIVCRDRTGYRIDRLKLEMATALR